MPVKIPNHLPAKEILISEKIFVIDDLRAKSQDIRPLKVAILNLMPNKIATETQLLRYIANSPLQVEITLLTTATYKPKNTDASHLQEFYLTFDDVLEQNLKFDGLMITGAPVEKLDFEAVEYWKELSTIFKWAEHNVHSTYFICWAAQAGLYYHYGIDKRMLDKKASGLYNHRVLSRANNLVRGFDDSFIAPHSRYTGVDTDAVCKCKEIEALAVSDEIGLYLLTSKDRRKVFVFGHGEYDTDSLHLEYTRDVEKGIDIGLPKNYYVDNVVGQLPQKSWRAHQSLLMSNWLNYYVYQSTPFDTSKIK